MSELETRAAEIAAQMRQTMARAEARILQKIADGALSPENPTDRVQRRMDHLAGITASHVSTTTHVPELAAIALAHAQVHGEVEAEYLRALDVERAKRDARPGSDR